MIRLGNTAIFFNKKRRDNMVERYISENVMTPVVSVDFDWLHMYIAKFI